MGLVATSTAVQVAKPGPAKASMDMCEFCIMVAGTSTNERKYCGSTETAIVSDAYASDLEAIPWDENLARKYPHACRNFFVAKKKSSDILCALFKTLEDLVIEIGRRLRQFSAPLTTSAANNTGLNSSGSVQSASQQTPIRLGDRNGNQQPSGSSAVQENADKDRTPPNIDNSVGVSVSGAEKFFILFGVQGPRRTLELDQIDCESCSSDQKFFRELRQRYPKLRGYLRWIFSVWRFRTCDFVKVRIHRPHFTETVSNDIAVRKIRC